MKPLVQAAIILAAAGAVLSLWLFSGVNWVNFFFFMVLVQPLFVAAFLEGGCRQLVASTPGRFAIGFGSAVLWFAYFRYAGRTADDARP